MQTINQKTILMKNFENSKINLEYQGYQQESYVQKNNNQALD